MENLTDFHIYWSPYNQQNISYSTEIYLDATNGLAAVTVLNEVDGSNAIYLEKIESSVLTHLIPNLGHI